VFVFLNHSFSHDKQGEGQKFGPFLLLFFHVFVKISKLVWFWYIFFTF